MKKVVGGLVFGVILVGMLGCTTSYQTLKTDYGQSSLNAKYKTGAYTAKVDNFVVILDASYSMNADVAGEPKFVKARNLVSRLNHAVPDMPLKAGLASFGGAYDDGAAKHYGLTTYVRQDFEQALAGVSETGWVASRMDKALAAVAPELAGRTALIVVSDGETAYSKTLHAVDQLVQANGDRLCIYSVQVGDSPTGFKLLQELARKSGCGFATTAAAIDTAQGMDAFVEQVFLKPGGKLVDTDADGVADSLDKCPGTPRGAAVDKQGCLLDTDADGVYDYLDLCPRTPRGTPVDEHGCAMSQPKGAEATARGSWILRGVQFDYAKAAIRPDVQPVLNEVAKVLNDNPQLRLEIQGHTDNRGPADFNQLLSARRAQAVRDYLAGLGIGAERLKAVGYGKTQPMATNATADGRAKNRRVEFLPIR